MKIKANGEVTLNGSFNLTSEANDVSIQQFNINPGPAGTGIRGSSVSGGQIKLNTITGGNQGIRFAFSSGVSITHNTISGGNWGIVLVAGVGLVCDNNIIAHNTITGITYASPIHLQGDCNNNLIRNNTITLKTGIFNAAIMLYSFPGQTCDNNIVRNNVGSGSSTVGLWLFDGGSNNTIGPNNTFNDNVEYGMILGVGSIDNHVFNNTARNNGVCDITNEGVGNTFVNNKADCTSGL